MVRKQTLFQAVSFCFDIPERMLARVLSDGSYSCRKVLIRADHSEGTWLILIDQTFEYEPTHVKAALRRHDGRILVASVATDDQAKDRPITDFYQFLETKALDADLVQGLAYAELEAIYTRKNHDTLIIDIKREQTKIEVPDVVVDMVYKSERSFWLGKNYKLLGLTVKTKDNLEFWGVRVNAEHRTEGPGLHSPAFGKLMALYRAGEHTSLVDLLTELQRKKHPWFELIKSEDVKLPVVFCTSPPKSNDEPPVYDTEVTPGRFYTLESEEKNTDSRTFYNIVVNGATLNRAANHFMKIRIGESNG